MSRPVEIIQEQVASALSLDRESDPVKRLTRALSSPGFSHGPEFANLRREAISNGFLRLEIS